MGDSLRAGSTADLSHWDDATVVSMAKEIEKAMKLILPPPVDDQPDDRRKFFIAIATGVINHLQQHQDAFTVQVPDLPFATRDVHPVIAVAP